MSDSELLKQIADRIEIPVFHTRDNNTSGAFLGDSFGAILARKIPDSLGSGLYLTSNIQEVIEWGEYKQVQYGADCSIYLYDLGQADNLKVFMEFYCCPGKTFACDEKTFDSVCEKFCHDNKLSVKAVKEWASDERQICLGRTGYDSLMGLESISTTFQKDMLHINGIDTSFTIESDSIGLGWLVFSPESLTPVYDFGSNPELARDFYRMVCDKITDRKLLNICEGDRETVQDLASWGYDSLSPDYSPEEYTDRLYERHKTLLSEKNKVPILGSFEEARIEARKDMLADTLNDGKPLISEKTRSSIR